MFDFYTEQKDNAIPIIIPPHQNFDEWLKTQDEITQNWLQAQQFDVTKPQCIKVPNTKGQIAKIICGYTTEKDFWAFAHIPSLIPPGCYLLGSFPNDINVSQFYLNWGLAQYRFTRYKKNEEKYKQLVLNNVIDTTKINNELSALFLVRDLINIPAYDLGPVELADRADKLCQQFHAVNKTISCQQQLAKEYPLLHAIGQASPRAPRLIDFTWGNESHPKLTLGGKGVCFDTGGLSMKNTAGMILMKKDMGGAAHVLALAQLIMASKLPVCLRVLIGAVENVVDATAIRPSDIIRARNGISIEITNTDAEGRLITCDALHEASTENPDLIIDMMTLTGAARVAVGTDIGAFFSNNNDIANQLLKFAEQVDDPICRLPLHPGYKKQLESPIADCINSPTSGYAGAITAALFLQQFISKNVAWCHFDIMAYNLSPRPGRPEGGEALALRTIWAFLQDRYR